MTVINPDSEMTGGVFQWLDRAIKRFSMSWDYIFCLLAILSTTALIFLIYNMISTGFLPSDPIRILVSPDLTVTVLGSLVTAATMLGFVVTAIGAVMVTRTHSEFDRLHDQVSRKMKETEARLETLGGGLDKYETFLTLLQSQGHKPPEQIEEEVMQRIGALLKDRYKPAAEIKAEVIDTVEKDILSRLVEEYRAVLQVSRIASLRPVTNGGDHQRDTHEPAGLTAGDGV